MSLGLPLKVLFSSLNLPVVAAVLLLIVARAWCEKRKRETDRRVPMVPYLIPWVGSALDIWSGPDAFFSRATAKYGDLFVVKTFGRTITYVGSPLLIDEIYRNPQKYEFERLLAVISITNFKLPASLVESGVIFKTVRPNVYKMLSPRAVIPIAESFTTNVWDLLRKECSRLEGVSTPLLDFISPLFYQASVCAFFGSSYPVAESYKPWCDFYGTIHSSLAGAPRFLLKKHLKALFTLHKLMEKHLDGPHDDAPELVLENERVMRSHGFGSEAMAPFFFVILVALETNSPIAAYWLIVLNLQREDGLKLLTDEVDEAITSWKRQHPGQEIEDHLYEIVTTADLPLLTSTIRETLRYTASIASIRRVTEPAELGGYRLNVGDEVACLARLVHFDEEIHENASEYDPKRYMSEKRLSKNGKTVVNHTMPWGGGVSMCPGRHFVITELKAFMLFLLMRYTVEIDPKYAERPTLRLEQIGIGVMDPRGDLRVILRARE